MKRLNLLLALALSLILSAARAADEEGFVSLFNGKDLTGWKGDKTYWSVQDGALTAKTTPENRLKYNTFLDLGGRAAGAILSCGSSTRSSAATRACSIAARSSMRRSSSSAATRRDIDSTPRVHAA